MVVKLLFFQLLFEKKKSKYITVKYYTENEFAKEPYQATEHSTEYVFAVETKSFLPKTVDTISLELKWAIPTGFYGKLFQ